MVKKKILSPLEYEKELAKGKKEVEDYNKLLASRTNWGKTKTAVGKGIDNLFKPQQARALPQAQPRQQFSAAQNMLREMFRGEPTFGTGQNLPKINGELRSGGGIIKNGDIYKETGRMFGLR